MPFSVAKADAHLAYGLPVQAVDAREKFAGDGVNVELAGGRQPAASEEDATTPTMLQDQDQPEPEHAISATTDDDNIDPDAGKTWGKATLAVLIVGAACIYFDLLLAAIAVVVALIMLSVTSCGCCCFLPTPGGRPPLNAQAFALAAMLPLSALVITFAIGFFSYDGNSRLWRLPMAVSILFYAASVVFTALSVWGRSICPSLGKKKDGGGDGDERGRNEQQTLADL